MRFRQSAMMPLLIAAFGVAVAWNVSIQNHAQADNPHAQIVSIGNDVTEIVYALGQGHRVLARDTTSNFPEEARKLPDVGYMRAISAEGVLAFGPEIILAVASTGPPEVVDVLRQTGITFVQVPLATDAESVIRKIKTVGEALGVEDEAKVLAKRVASELEQASAAAQNVETPKRVLFLISAQGGKLMAAGRDTSADAMIKLAGGENAISGFSGYKVLEDEAATTSAPDVVLMMKRGRGAGITAETLFALPSLSTTPAAMTRSLFVMDGAKLLGFGPRVGEAVRELNAKLYED